ncbi:hypothetical protein E8E13_004808 [Curvularia kusanoi]|uniref:Uncharacterized protein n=1 Tax=Curvularia kusanoi TaxID=90978 RepID=A0A9P4TFC3_CURKU|nr:hypothetical protein E8E13_004808 [Curvularia kusanoi]
MTLSGRFIQRVVLPVTCAVETLTNPRNGTPATSLPTVVQFGDLLRSRNGENVPPAVIGKLWVNRDDQVRLVGELKFCGTADLQRPIMLADLPGEMSDPKELCNILGQAFNWMTMHKVLFGFFSSYNWTIFLRIAMGKDGKPCLYYTDTIPHSDVTSSNKTISVRTAFFYLVHLTGGPNAVWRIPQKDVDKYAGEYVSRNLDKVGKVQQPYSQSAMLDGEFR